MSTLYTYSLSPCHTSIYIKIQRGFQFDTFISNWLKLPITLIAGKKLSIEVFTICVMSFASSFVEVRARSASSTFVWGFPRWTKGIIISRICYWTWYLNRYWLDLNGTWQTTSLEIFSQLVSWITFCTYSFLLIEILAIRIHLYTYTSLIKVGSGRTPDTLGSFPVPTKWILLYCLSRILLSSANNTTIFLNLITWIATQACSWFLIISRTIRIHAYADPIEVHIASCWAFGTFSILPLGT